jgi:acetyl esterase/lipase
MRASRITGLASAVILILAAVSGSAATERKSGLEIAQDNRLTPNITYLTAGNSASRLDVIGPMEGQPARPVLLYIHGGGWIAGSKERMFLHFIPYLEMGMAVVNVGYRLGGVALAPAAVEDTRCALRWLYENGESYGLDTTKIVVSGHSAGGHLSLTTGMLEAEGGLDRLCPVRRPVTGVADGALPEMPVAAIVNWFGITDVADLVTGPNAKQYAMAWMGNQTDWRTIADRVSPMFMIRDRLPPVLTIHGDADTIVPYTHATRLHEALRKQGAKEKLHTISGGGHGRFTLEENIEAMRVIRDFLVEHEIL